MDIRTGVWLRAADGLHGLSESLDKALVDTFLYRLYRMFLAVLAERMAAYHDGQDGPGSRLSVIGPWKIPTCLDDGPLSGPKKGSKMGEKRGIPDRLGCTNR